MADDLSWVIVYRIDDADVEKLITWWDRASTTGITDPFTEDEEKQGMLPHRIALLISEMDGAPSAVCAAVFVKKPPSEAAMRLSKLWESAEAGKKPVLVENAVSRIRTASIVPGASSDNPADIGRYIIFKPQTRPRA
jgi:hypothetical protein